MRPFEKLRERRRRAWARTDRPWPSLVRVFLLASVGVCGAVYGLWRAAHFVPQPMLVPAPVATEIPAPDLEK